MRKVLIISYHFPPATEVGGIRAAKFAKYLPEFGWKPYVLTIREQYLTTRDWDRLTDIAGIPIARTTVFPTLPELILRLRNRLKRILRLSSTVNATPRNRSEDQSFQSCFESIRFFRTLRRYFISLFELPDQQIGWLLPAIYSGYRLIQREGIEVILATAPPTTPVLVGLILSRVTSAKLVTDLRDPFILHETKPKEIRSGLADAIERRLEQAIKRRSSRIITTTERYARRIRSLDPDLQPGAVCTISNGYDPNDFSSIRVPRNGTGKFVISYLGTFYYGRTPKEFLSALGQLVATGQITRDALQVSFLGDVHFAEGIPLNDLIESNGLRGCVTLHGTVPYRQALTQMLRSDVLLLLAPGQPDQVPGKAYEYLGAGRIILCVADDGATADLIRTTGTGHVVTPNDFQGMKDALLHLYLNWRSGFASQSPRCTSGYHRKLLARDLAHALNAGCQSS